VSIVAVHGPNTFGSKGVVESGPAMATPNPSNGLQWTFKLDSASTRTTSLSWNFGSGATPATATGPGPHSVTYGAAGNKTVTSTATGAGEGANPYPPAGVTTMSITAVSGAAPQLLMAPGGEEGAPSEMGSQEAAPETAPGTSPNIEEVLSGTVDEVKTWAEANPDYIAELYEAETAGQNRSTLVAWLEQRVPFDPGNYTVTQVIGYAEDYPDEIDAIIAAEQAGKNRTTLISQLEAMRTA
jgi:PKD repeat protein